MGRDIQYPFPEFRFDVSDFGSQEGLNRFIQLLLRYMKDTQIQVRDVVNFNNISYISQAGQPTPDNGAAVLWNDTAATAGQPTHYLVFTDDDGNTVTFASEEVV